MYMIKNVYFFPLTQLGSLCFLISTTFSMSKLHCGPQNWTEAFVFTSRPLWGCTPSGSAVDSRCHGLLSAWCGLLVPDAEYSVEEVRENSQVRAGLCARTMPKVSPLLTSDSWEVQQQQGSCLVINIVSSHLEGWADRTDTSRSAQSISVERICEWANLFSKSVTPVIIITPSYWWGPETRGLI